MSQTPDLSKIVSLIMENPELIKQIKNLTFSAGENESNTETADTKENVTPVIKEDKENTPEAAANASTYEKGIHSKKKRRELLCALKPFVSEGRSSAIDTMLTLSDVLDVIKER